MNSIELLKMMIQAACADGVVTDDERQHLSAKAKEIGIAEADLDFLIKGELDRLKSQNQSQNSELHQTPEASGFVTNQQPDQQLGSGFETHSNQSGFETNKKLPHQEFTDIVTLSSQGAMSLVQKARYLGKWVIIKRIKPEHKDNPKYKELFYKEFENAYHLDHEHIVRLFGKGEDKNGAYFFMEYVDGRPLTEIIQPGGIKDKKLVQKIFLQILNALSYVHKRQIYHRDLKPDNILVTYKGDNVKILDFGLAAADAFDDRMKKVGTPKYAAPEQMQQGNKADHRADIYAAGLILLEMITGQTKQTQGKIPDPKYAELIKKATAQNPENRFNDCDEMIRIVQSTNIQTRIPDWLEKKIRDFTTNGTLSENELKVLTLDAKNAGIDHKYFQALIDLNIEKAKERIQQQGKREEELRRQKEKQKRAEQKQKARQQPAPPPPTRKKRSVKTFWLILFFVTLGALAIYIFQPELYRQLFDKAAQTFTDSTENATPDTTSVKAGYLNLRAEASNESEILGKYPRGTQVLVLKIDEKGYWAKVKIEDKKGYMALRYLENSEELKQKAQETQNQAEKKQNQEQNQEIPPKTGETYYITSKNLPLRESKRPNIESNIIEVFPLGTAVRVLEKDNLWAKVQVQGKTGFMESQYLATEEQYTRRGGKIDPTKIYYVSRKTAPLRQGDGIFGDVIKQFGYGTKVKVFQIKDNWAQVEIESEKGFIHTRNIEPEEEFLKRRKNRQLVD